MLVNKIKMVPKVLGKARYNGSFPVEKLTFYGTRGIILPVTNIESKDNYNCTFTINSRLKPINGEIQINPGVYSAAYSAKNIFIEDTTSYCYGTNGNTVDEPSITIIFDEPFDITALEFSYPVVQSDNFADYWDFYLNNQNFPTAKDINLNGQEMGSTLRADLKMKLFKKLDGTSGYYYLQI